MGIARENDLLKIKHRLDALDIRLSVLEKEVKADAERKTAPTPDTDTGKP